MKIENQEEEIDDPQIIRKELDEQFKGLEKVTVLQGILANPLINNEYLLKQMCQYIQTFNNTLRNANLALEILPPKESIQKLSAQYTLALTLSKGLNKVHNIKKDRILQKSMLGELFQWLEKITIEYVDKKNESFNPFKSIQDQAEFRNNKAALLMGPGTPETDFKQLKQETPYLYTLETTTKQFQSLVPTNQQSSNQLPLTDPTYQKQPAYLQTEVISKDQPFYMTFYKDKIAASKAQLEGGGSIAEAVTTIPQSERVYNFTTQQDRSMKNSNPNLVQIHIKEHQPLSTAEILFKEHSVTSSSHNLDMTKMLNDSDNDSHHDNDHYPDHLYKTHDHPQQVQHFNPFNTQTLTDGTRFPTIPGATASPMLMTQTSMNSSVNYPNGIVYQSMLKNKQKLLRQYQPLREVPKVFDLTRDTTLQAQILNTQQENEDLLMASMSKTNRITFMKGGLRSGAVDQEKKLPQKTMFQDFNASLNNYFSMGESGVPEDQAAAEKDFFKKERELNLQGQAVIYQLKTLKPYEEIPLDKQDQQLVTDDNAKKSNRRRKSNQSDIDNNMSNDNAAIEDTILLRIKQMESQIQQLAKTQDKGSAFAYPFLQRGSEVEHYSQHEMEIIKRHMASIGINLPTKTLEKAILIPKDLDPEGRKYPKIGDLLMKNAFKKAKNQSASKKRARSTNNTGRAAGVASNGSNNKLPLINEKLMKTGYSTNLYYKIEKHDY